MLPRSLLRPGLLSLLLLLQACVQAPTEPQSPEDTVVTSNRVEEVPEIILNLPDGTTCACEEEIEADYTFLEKGFVSMARGDHEEALEYFSRYRRLESSPAADWEAAIAIAFIKSLGDSPYHDAEEARKSYRELVKEDWQSMQLHEQTLLLRQSLENFRDMDREIAGLKAANRSLREDLKKREEAIQRLRELTLGQPAVTQ
ncbi:hypothetical protein E2F43_01800 [Seongchinamella unica]|uniref:Uncharacterized protein n=1 Tax=Seongchinamella unica TaxID=2547392 RepID=A0A4R5LUD7_9GAMM|nr:hypothetical protein [Seongchinamella unica]TDG14999.1 hypothetical protein E2F43_01800 [Seongchinamella unica]